MTEDEIYTKLNAIFRDLLDDEAITLTPDMTADDVPGWDSMTHVNITVACEAEFGINFSTAELEELHRVGDLVALIEQKQARR